MELCTLGAMYRKAPLLILKALRAWGTSGNFEGDFACPGLRLRPEKNNKNPENMTTPPISKIDAKNESDWTRNASKAGTGKRWTCDSSYPILSHAILRHLVFDPNPSKSTSNQNTKSKNAVHENFNF